VEVRRWLVSTLACLPHKKRIGEHLVWVAEELQRLLKNSSIIFKKCKKQHFIT
jgi:hypothetical protein